MDRGAVRQTGPVTLDIERLRSVTPACADQTFLDNAGSALSPASVTASMIDYLELEQQVGGYAAAEDSVALFELIHADIAELAGCRPQNVALATSATAAYMRALSAIQFEPGDRVLMTSAEYGSNVLPLLQLRDRIGISVEVIPDGDDGTADPVAFANLLDDKVKLVSLTHAASQNGLVIDAKAFGDALRDHPAWFLLDTCQSVGQVPVDLTSMGADFVTGTGRKWLRGPRGTGFLGTSQRVMDELEPMPIDMYGAIWQGTDYTMNPDASRFQSFEIPYAAMIGMGNAVRYGLDLGMELIFERIRLLADSLRDQLSALPNVRVLDRGTTRSGIVTFNVPGTDAMEVAARLRRDHRITLSPLSPNTNPIDYARSGATCALRASAHVYNTEAELATLVAAIETL